MRWGRRNERPNRIIQSFCFRRYVCLAFWSELYWRKGFQPIYRVSARPIDDLRLAALTDSNLMGRNEDGGFLARRNAIWQ